MKSRNFLSKFEFVYEQFFLTIVTWIIYKRILFRCLPACSFFESKLILLGIIATQYIVKFVMKKIGNRNEVSISFDLISGYGIYTVLTYYQIRRTLVMNCLIIFGILSIIYSILIMSQKIKNRKEIGRTLCGRIVRIVSATQKFMGMGFTFIMLVSGINILFGSSIMKSKVNPETRASTNGQLSSNKMETLILLQEDSWSMLTIQERLDVLQTVANIERKYFGLPNELNIGAANLNEGIMGYYSDKTHEIILSMDSLLYDSPWILLDTVCHEAYHSYQYRMVDAWQGADECNKNLKLFSNANSYASEFNNYIEGDENFCDYYSQDCESDARKYAEDSVADYYLKIHEYLCEKEE